MVDIWRLGNYIIFSVGHWWRTNPYLMFLTLVKNVLMLTLFDEQTHAYHFWLLKNLPFFWNKWRMYQCPPFLASLKNIFVPTHFDSSKECTKYTLFDICEERAHAPTFWLLERTYLYPPFLTQVKNVIIPTLLDSSLWFLSNKFNIKKI